MRFLSTENCIRIESCFIYWNLSYSFNILIISFLIPSKSFYVYPSLRSCLHMYRKEFNLTKWFSKPRTPCQTNSSWAVVACFMDGITSHKKSSTHGYSSLPGLLDSTPFISCHMQQFEKIIAPNILFNMHFIELVLSSGCPITNSLQPETAPTNTSASLVIGISMQWIMCRINIQLLWGCWWLFDLNFDISGATFLLSFFFSRIVVWKWITRATSCTYYIQVSGLATASAVNDDENNFCDVSDYANLRVAVTVANGSIALTCLWCCYYREIQWQIVFHILLANWVVVWSTWNFV